MERNIEKSYDKIMKHYEKGELDKALELCEEYLADNLQNPKLLNLKGFILYQKGNLKEAVTVWKLNSDINKDSLALSYVKDAESDEERFKLYKYGEQCLKNLKIDEALELFTKCKASDFNSIKVNTGIALCYQKKGDYYRAQEYVNKALEIDKNAVTASKLNKELNDMGLYNGSKSKNKGVVVAGAIAAIIALGAGSYYLNSKTKINNTASETAAVNEVHNDTQENDDTESDDNSVNNIDNNQVAFDKNKVQEFIDSKDYDNLYTSVNDIDKKSLSNEDLAVYNSALNVLNSDGVQKFYEYGLWYYNQGNYESAKSELEKAYTYCDESYLKQDIIFYRGSNAIEKNDNELALKMYEEYYNLYPQGSYTEGVLYQLALLTFDSNKDKSKKYANNLLEKYPKSIYINDRLNNILNN